MLTRRTALIPLSYSHVMGVAASVCTSTRVVSACRTSGGGAPRAVVHCRKDYSGKERLASVWKETAKRVEWVHIASHGVNHVPIHAFPESVAITNAKGAFGQRCVVYTHHRKDSHVTLQSRW